MKKVFAIIVSLFFYQLLFSQTHRKQVTAFDVLYQEFSDSCHLSKMIIDEKRQLFFLGTNKGLFCFDEDKQIYHLNKINNIPFSISRNSMLHNILYNS